MRKFGLGRALSGVFALALLAPASAFAGDRIGSLQCRLLGNGISVLVENQQIDCMYRDDAEGAVPAHYVGALTKVGANVTINGPGELAWGVVSATSHIGPGALAGAYYGPGFSAKVRGRRRRRGARRRLQQHFLAAAIQHPGRLRRGLDGWRRAPDARLCPAAAARPCCAAATSTIITTHQATITAKPLGVSLAV